jgi:Type I phosphodiesterase / nucleotide pyrophosphatase
VISDILPSAFAVVGSPAFGDTLGLADRVGTARRVVLLLADGLGYDLLSRAAKSSPLLAEVVAGRAGRLDEQSCALPSTTPTSIVSLGTGSAPGEHGVLGFTLNVPGTDRVLTHVRWTSDPEPASWVPVPTLHTRAGVPSAVVLPSMFRGSGLTQVAYAGATFIGLGRRDDHAVAVRHALDSGAQLVMTYISRVDVAAHGYGIASPEWAAACRSAGELIERLLHALPADTALIVTADHGGLDVPTDARLDIAADARLSAGVRVVAGEPRFRYLHTVDGARADVHAAWSSILGPRATVLTREQAVESGLFGPVRDSHVERIGDVVMLSNDNSAVFATGHEPDEVARLIAFHGAATHAETAIPLITFGCE